MQQSLYYIWYRANPAVGFTTIIWANDGEFTDANTCQWASMINTLRPRQNDRRFPEYITKYMFLNENVWISLKISHKFIPKIRITNIPAVVQIMAWRRPGDKPLSEPM